MFPGVKNLTARRLFFCLVTILIAACQAQPAPAAVSPPPDPTTTPTPIPTATSTAVPAPSPMPSPTARLGCPDAHGSVSPFEVKEKGFDKAMDVLVYLPPCYSASYPGGYPVLYMIHGQSFTNDQWVRLGVPETADADFISGRLKPFIVVMPREEYYLEDWFESHFGDNLAAGLVPWVDGHFHTCSQRTCRAIGGLSRGATWAVVLGLTYWQLFGTIGAHSLPDSPYTEASTRDRFWAMRDQPYPRLWIDIGEIDGLRSGAEKFKGYLEKYKIPFDWHLNPGSHNEDYWRAHVPEYLMFYGQAWN